jgi:outer membrane PBP1 activator LpoA protein
MRKKILGLIIIFLVIGGCANKPNVQTPFTTAKEHPQQVALMVPLHGELGDSGKAIRNGFLAAYYYSLQHGQSKTKIKIIDTSSGDIPSLYQQAIDNSATFVIGPLTKQNVQSLVNLGSLSVPTLALNTVDNYQQYNVSNLYQFGLFSLDEANQVAMQAWQEHPGRALIIAPTGDWGARMVNAVQNTWQSLGGDVSGVTLYDENQNFNNQVQHALNVDLSQTNAQDLQKIIWRKFKFIPRRRQDIDVIFLIAQPKPARQIRPLLQFYFAGDIPVYSTSVVYAGIPQPDLDHDLDGVEFCDIPWLLQDTNKLPPILPELRQQITTLWPSSYQRYTRLYALGIDSYYLMLNLHKLINKPDAGIEGASGIFYIDSHNHIFRQLDWAKMQNGVPHLV